MTQKELLYVEDALNHAKFLKNMLSSSSKNLKSYELRNETTHFEEWAAEIYNSIYDLLCEE
ncbi:MAG: hypothetical protein IKC22_06120 [Bacilli bacterium]|nr:hypothetical protein [Bacilli bacterium]